MMKRATAMMGSVLCSGLFFGQATVFAAPQGSPLEAVQSYLLHTHAVIDEINSQAPAAQVIAQHVGEMMALIPTIHGEYSVRHPGCKAQLVALDGFLPQLANMSAVDIRRNIEAGTALPPGSADCYPARDIVAHPAIVRSLAVGQNPAAIRTRLLREINEALEHGGEIEAEFAQ